MTHSARLSLRISAGQFFHEGNVPVARSLKNAGEGALHTTPLSVTLAFRQQRQPNAGACEPGNSTGPRYQSFFRLRGPS